MTSNSQSQPSKDADNHPPSAPTESDKGKEKPEVNIFTSIGTFIDSKISSALQSVIGLPSAMSKSGGGGRWMVYDEAARKRQEEEMGKWGGSPPEGKDEGNNGGSGGGGGGEFSGGPDSGSGEQQSKRTMWTKENWDAGRNRDESENAREGGWGWWNRGEHSSRWHKHRGCRRHKKDEAAEQDYSSTSESAEHCPFPYRRRRADPFQAENSFPFLMSTLFDEADDFPFLPSLFPRNHPFPIFQSHPFFSAFPDPSLISGPAWPISYVIFSPYSPLHLERQRAIIFPLGESTPPSRGIENPGNQIQWRDAFEDLLRTEMGKEMLKRQEIKSVVKGEEDGGEWIKSLIQRGSLGDWKVEGLKAQDQDNQETDTLSSMIATRVEELDQDEQPITQKPNHSTNTRFSTEESDPLTEADVYEHIFRSKEPEPDRVEPTPKETNVVTPYNTEASPHNPSFTPPAPQQTQIQTSNAPKDSIISTLTTTTRTTMPDGSVQTKVILKKRFGDGREEVKETEHLDYQTSAQQSKEVRREWTTDERLRDAAKPKPQEGKKQGGWFWN